MLNNTKNIVKTQFNNQKILTQAQQERRRVCLQVVRRSSAFDVELPRGDPPKPLGIAASPDKDPGFLTVEEIRSEGLVPSWNKENGSLMICSGDAITAVGDIRGTPLQLLNAIQSVPVGGLLKLRIEDQIH